MSGIGGVRDGSPRSRESDRLARTHRWQARQLELAEADAHADQFPTRYFVLYFGWTFDLMSRSCTRSGHRGQRAYSCLVAAEGLCTNAPSPPEWSSDPRYMRQPSASAASTMRAHASVSDFASW